MKVHFKTYGCQMNERDSDAAFALLAAQGHSAAAGEEDADLVVLNTCSVRDQAERKALGKLGVLCHLKRSRPGLIIGVMGCMAQRLGRELIDKLPDLDFVIGTDQIKQLPEIVAELALSSGAKASATDWEPDNLGGMDAHRAAVSGERPFSAFVSISRGCNRFCSYCIVPYVRGREHSRDQASIVEEVRKLAASGVKEITLLGQNVAAYGLDGIAPPVDDAISPFAELLEKVDAVEGIERIRFTSPHPAFFNSRLIEAMASLPKVCECVHLPLQSGSDRILKLMNRPYSAARYLEIVDSLKSRIPDICFSTDVIVGFPGESDADFQVTRELMEKVDYDNAYVFKYSPRSGTKAAAMPDDVAQDVKELRNKILLEDHKRRVAKAYAAQAGRVVQAMAEGPSKRNPERWSGLSRNGRHLIFTPPPGLAPGSLIELRVVRASSVTLFGEPLSQANPATS